MLGRFHGSISCMYHIPPQFSRSQMPPRSRTAAASAPVVETAILPVDSISTLIAKCFDPKATSADVGRLYKMKDGLGTMNWESPESLDMKSQLVSCFECRVFYKSAQGINFLALVYNLHPLMVGPISEVVKRCILAFPPPLIKGCSEVLFKAWQISTGGMRIVLEQSITDWMRKALFTCTGTAERVRFLLSEIHSVTRTKEIDEMLSRYYGPILFRHTKVANWEVRFNAIALLCAAFPVIPPDRTAIEFEEKLTIQFRVLKDSMEDPNEAVRKCAVVGTGRILRDFWEVLTIEQIAMVLDCMAQKAGRDKKSVKTRMASIDALSLIVDNPLSHGVLMELLPSTCQLLNDESPAVRLKYVEFLCKVSKFRTIAIPQIVTQPILFARIAIDHALSLHHPSAPVYKQIAALLTSIVSPSLFSSSVEDQVVKSERMAESLPQGFLALLASCGSCVSELDRVRLAVAVSSRAIAIVLKNNTNEPRKLGTARVLFRGSTELLRTTQFANLQGTEELFTKDSENGKLVAFIYRHVADRDVCRFLDLCVDNPVLAELLDWLSVLDGARLPQVFTKLEEWLKSNSVVNKQVLTRVASNWGIYSGGVISSIAVDNWSTILAAVRSSNGSPNLAVAVDSVIATMEVGLRLNDLRAVDKSKSEITTFVQSISSKLPNVKFVPRVIELIQLSLGVLLRLHQGSASTTDNRRVTEASSDFSTGLHRFNIGLISSLTTAPIPARPATKKQKLASPVDDQAELIEVAMNANEMASLCHFYLSYLLVCSVLTGIPLKATKFEDLARVYLSWIDKDPSILSSGEGWKQMADLVASCVESQQGPWAGFAILEGAIGRVNADEPQQETVDTLTSVALRDFGFSQELASLITKLSISNTHARVLESFGKAAEGQDTVPQVVRQMLAGSS